MCGIFGELTAGSDPIRRRSFADGAVRQLRHRGPDGAGSWSDDSCLLGHTRLAVLDLTERAAQPMHSASGRSVFVFNGELYNYVEIREQLAPPPGGWRSSGDSEVLLELLEAHGLPGLARTVGMFAVALWRPAERELWLIRDRLGKKPLYYALTPDGCLRFASEIGALLADGVLPRRTTPDRLAEYLQHGYVAAPRTGFLDIACVPPASVLRVRLAEGSMRTTVERYWALPATARAPARAAWLEQLDWTVRDAVRIRLRSDVALGAFLSGGVDSSIVSMLAQRMLGGGLRTYTVDFGEPEYSEGAFAREVAAHLGTEHTELALAPSSVEELPALVATYGDLHGDSSALPTLAVCRATRQHATVALSGDGGDELLGGYSRYRLMMGSLAAAARWPDRTLAVLRGLGEAVVPWWLRGRGLLYRMTHDLGRLYAESVRFYGTVAWPPILAPELCAPWPDVVSDALAEHRARAPLLRLMACDTVTYLPGDILVKVDRASMSVGLEVRAPLLDHRLFELAARAEPSWLVDGRGAKAPMRELYGSHLPPSVFARRKMGFGVPLGHWFRGGMGSYAADKLLDPQAAVAPVLDRAGVRALIWSHQLRNRDESARIWQALVLHAWFEAWRPSVTVAAGEQRAA
jgi:asparagine synthase (glutamine-hydrolysing)